METYTFFIKCSIVALVLGVSGCGAPAKAEPLFNPGKANDWQIKRLFEPTPGQRANERNGRIVIYDGLKDRTVNKVLDREFERLQHMMFTRVIQTEDSGEPKRDDAGQLVFEDDGC